MNIRRLNENDLENLAGLYRQFWGDESSLVKMQETFQKLEQDPNYIFLVAEIEDRLAGSVMGIICEELYGECRPFMVIEDVVVDKQNRREGIASLLMRELEDRAAGRNCSHIIFVTESTRSGARKFYESLGYDAELYHGFKKKVVDRYR